ncbi:MAG: FkbM family methyltransferase [Chloroherpetonaceae bacterium]|nr:FkbM family methyltransferase [Chloroherpetonaceae bacterium]MDW8436503.1 FkbM family methyltransferase [Chloroherpetonaceae bacterium]
MWLANKVHGLKSIWKFDNRYQLLLSRLFFRSNGLNVYRLNGMEFLVDHSAGDESGTRLVLTSQMYQQFLPQMKFAKPMNVLDLGGNGGGLGLMLKLNGLPIKKIVAVEFNPNTCARMRFNLERNLDAEIIALNAAACGESKTLKLKIGKGGTSDSIYNPLSAQNGKEIEIQGVTLDELYEKYFKGESIDLCKMDIEGAEHEIFAFPHHSALKHIRVLLMEIHGNDQAKNQKILETLRAFGFEEIKGNSIDEQDVRCFKNSNLS